MKFRTIGSLSVLAATIIPTYAATVTIRPGDTLTALAAQYLGDAGRWQQICEANPIISGNCNFLPVGSVIELPSDETAASGASTNPNNSGDSKADSDATSPEPSVISAPSVGEMRKDIELREFAPEKVDVALEEGLFEGSPVKRASTTVDSGQHRIRFGFTAQAEELLTLTWAFKPESDSSILMLCYDPDNGSYATMDVRVGGEELPGVITTGSFDKATVERAEDGWYRLRSELSVLPTQANTQILIYPTGQIDSEGTSVSLLFTDPVLTTQAD